MSDIVYAVHTRACTYLLDEEGICRWVLSRSGARSDDRCVGAQFVAALDLRSRGGLVGELRIGAQALFIRSDGGRFMLIRTKPIEHVEIRGAQAEVEDPYQADEYPTEPEPEPEPVVLPSHHAVAGVFEAPMRAPEPEPPSEQRVIVQAPMPSYYEPPPPVPLRAPPPAPAPPPARAYTEPLPRGHTEPPPPPAPPPMVTRPPLPIAPPRTPAPVPAIAPQPAVPRARASRNDEAQATQPLPPAGPPPPNGPVPAWPPMLAPPPPQAELLPLGPVRPEYPSSEELDEADLEEVGEDDQVYSMEVTLSLPLFRTDTKPGQAWRR